MLRIFALVGLIFFSQSILAAGQARYISDDVYLFLHGGPGTQYRILGSIEAGQEISVLNETEGGFSKIIDHKGREGWIETKMINTQKSLRMQLPELQAQLAKAQSKLAKNANSNDSNTQELDEIKAQLTKTETMLNQASAERDKANHKLASIEHDERFEMWQEGAMIAGIGILVGIFLVYLPRPRQKKKNSW